MSSLRSICETFPSFYSQEVIEKVDIEWRLLIFCPLVDSIIKDDCTIGAEKFCGIVSDLKDGSQQTMYPLVSSLAQDLLTLPIANDACGRVFSAVHNIKTKQRNRFSTEGIASLMFRKQGLNGDCSSLKPSDKMFFSF